MKKARQRNFGFMNWGGKRRGAGRKHAGQQAGVSHARRERLAARFPVLVTMKLRKGLASLRGKETHTLLKAACAASSSERFRVVEYSVQSNHLHLLVESREASELSRGMIGLAVRIARSLNKGWKRMGSVFVDRFHARILRTPREVRVALIYVLQNARKHGAWRAKGPDVYSSGTDFEGWRRGKTDVQGAGALRPRLLPRARTWLLSVGWLRHGSIDLSEMPDPATR